MSDLDLASFITCSALRAGIQNFLVIAKEKYYTYLHAHISIIQINNARHLRRLIVFYL